MKETDDKFEELKPQLLKVIDSLNTPKQHQELRNKLEEHTKSVTISPEVYKALEEKFGEKLANTLLPIINTIAKHPEVHQLLRRTLAISLEREEALRKQHVKGIQTPSH